MKGGLKMKKAIGILFLVAAFSLVAATNSMAAYTYADAVISANMNMNWLNNPGTDYSSPNPYDDRLLGAYDQYAVGWGPAGSAWTGAANTIVEMGTSFTNDGVVATESVNYDVTDEATLQAMGYDLIIYGLGYGFDTAFGSHGQINVYVSDYLSDDVNDWTLVSGWSGEPNGTSGVDYFENQDGTLYDGVAFNNGGFSAESYTYMAIDLDNLKIIDPDTGELMTLAAATGEYKYIWFEGGYFEDDGATHGNANFLDAFAANAVPVPGAVWLLGSGLIGIIGFRRRKA
jgi:hypothetical protein